DGSGNEVEGHGFDAFGGPRARDWQPSGSQLHPGGDFGVATTRGFTGHEHLDDTFLIHMNGRVYDYRLGRFLSVDPIISNPMNGQSINPYSYIDNNPLSGVDPSGYACAKVTGSNICYPGDQERLREIYITLGTRINGFLPAKNNGANSQQPAQSSKVPPNQTASPTMISQQTSEASGPQGQGSESADSVQPSGGWGIHGESGGIDRPQGTEDIVVVGQRRDDKMVERVGKTRVVGWVIELLENGARRVIRTIRSKGA